MLQDTLRSAVHTSPMRPAPVNGSRRTSCPRSSMGEEGKRSGEESGERSHLQLFQASEGARELARMIDSLSKAPSLDGRSKDIAKDLLRGARDLQSSLAMLARLQEASKSSDVCRSRVKGRLEQRTARPKRFALREEVGLEEAKGSRRFGLQEPRKMPSGQRPEFLKQEMGVGGIMVSERLGSRKSRFSVDGSSRHGAEEEMKTTSRLKFKLRFEYAEEGTGGVGVQKPRSSGRSPGELERTSRFKLKQRPERVEEAFCAEQTAHSKRFGSPEEEPRLSVDSIEELRRVVKDGLSRQEEELSGPTPAIIFQPKQAKGPNLIAKLMGLEEEVPPATVQTNKTEDETRRRKTKSLIMPRHAFDIVDRPKARKTQATETTTTPSPTHKSLHEIVAALQFKGLLRSGRGFDASQFKMFSISFNKEEEEEEAPPIVIMKPLYLPHWKRGETKSTEETSGGVSPMANALTTVAQKLQRKKGSKNSKKTDGGQKPLLDVKKEERDDIEKKISHNKILQTTSSTSVAKENKKKKKKKKKTSAAKSIRKSPDTKAEDEHCEDEKRSNLQEEGKDLFPKKSSLAVHGLTEGAYKQAKPCIQDGKQENLCGMMRKTATRVASEVEEDLMCLLLSSRSFTNHAKELFLIDAPHQPVHYKRKGIGEDVMRNAKLYLDCGKELMARKSNQTVNKYSSLCGSSASPSLTRLAEEISTLVASYSQIDYNVTSGDELYPRLERDLWSKDTVMASANWDIGWADWVCTEEATRVVGEVEEFILGWLLTEVAQDLLSV